MFAKKVVDGRFEHEGVVDDNVAYFGGSIPARLIASSDALTHHIVRNEEHDL